jgi:ribosome maturation factor RimP
MGEAEGVAEFVHRLLQSAAPKALRVGVKIEPEQRDDAGVPARLGNAKDEVQIAGVEVDVGDGKRALSLDRKRQVEQGISMELASPGIKRPLWHRALSGQLDIETHAAQILRKIVEGALTGVADRQQSDAGHVGHGID